MPNGYHGGEAEWINLEAPLRELDPILEAFAAQHGLKLTRNYRGDPERSLKNEDELSRLIQIFPADEKGQTYKVWLCASQDRGPKRYWKQRFIAESATPAELKRSIHEWLTQGYSELAQWKAGDLVFATELHPLK